mmetsp:Transcript_11999/g.24424  ORF Transcript_11999/g.24424 Transcript_11999/m.24424 type:complete len:95 (+) Transcript_11999:319-603(+)
MAKEREKLKTNLKRAMGDLKAMSTENQRLREEVSIGSGDIPSSRRWLDLSVPSPFILFFFCTLSVISFIFSTASHGVLVGSHGIHIEAIAGQGR